MREYFLGRRREVGFFFRKIYDLERVQLEINDIVRRDIIHMTRELLDELETASAGLDQASLDLIRSQLLSNIVELRLNIETIIVNFRRITGLKISREGELDEKERNYFRKGQLLFLLDKTTSRVYAKVLIYLKEELRSELSNLRRELGNFSKNLGSGQDIREDIARLSGEYFRINSQLNLIIEDINENIDAIYGDVTRARDKNINLGFLLTSAFLSVILFFPEFNNMINLKDAEVNYSEKMDGLIYEKALDEISCRDLINIKEGNISPEMRARIDIDLLEDIIRENMEAENKSLEREKDRINIFFMILIMVLVPYVLWIIFVAI